MLSSELSGNERILAIAVGRHWLEEAQLPAIRAALGALPEADAADLLHEQGIIDSDKQDWLHRQASNHPREAPRDSLVDRWLMEAAEQGASDLHLAPHHPPLCRRHGLFRSLGADWGTLSPRQVDEIVERILPSSGREALARQGLASLPYGADPFRVRLTVGRDAKGPFLSFRLPFPRPLELGELGAEEAVRLTTIPSGLVVLSGGSGQGKSALFAALARQIHRSRAGRLVLLEEVPEYVWNEAGPRVVRIALSRLGTDRDQLLRAAFSLDPDALLLDACVPPGTLRLLVEETARTGALVVTTLGLRGVAEVLRKLCVEMPKGASRSLLARTLRAVLAMELVPNATGKGRLAATELFWNVPAARIALTKAEPGEMESVLVAGGGAHFQPIDDSLWRLFQQGLVSMEAAYARCRYRPRWVERLHTPDSPNAP